MFTMYCWKKDGRKLWLIGLIIVFLFNWKWALFLTSGYIAYLFTLGLLRWWVDSRAEGQDDFL